MTGASGRYGADRSVTELEALLARTFQTHQHQAVTYCVSILGSRELADDAVQTAFATLLRRIRAGDAAFFAASPWEAVKRNLRWAALKQRRDQALVEHWFAAVDGDHPSKDRSSEVEQQIVVHGILGRLPTHMVQVLRLRFFEDQPDALSAAELGITLDAFRCRCKRAIHAARDVAQSLGVEKLATMLLVLPQRGWRRLRQGRPAPGQRGAGLAGRLSAVAQGPSTLLLRGPIAEMIMMASAVATVSVVRPAPAWVAVSASPPQARATATMPVRAGAPGSAPRAVATEHRAAPPRAASFVPALPAAPAPVVYSAADETPDDAHLYAVTGGSPSPSGHDPIVALGWGMRCYCPVVFQSTDGGGTWQAAPGPNLDMGQADQVLVPPTYPADPRILVTGPAGVFGAAAYMAPQFGGRFVPLPVPAGAMSLAPTFDRGDDRIFVAGTGAVWTYSLTSHVAEPVVLGQVVTAVDAIAVPPQPGPISLFVVADTPTLDDSTRSSLFACPSATSCAVLATFEDPHETAIRISPAFAVDHTIVVTWLMHLAVSRDGGMTFTDRAAPPGVDRLSSSVITSRDNGGPELWMLGDGAGSHELLRYGVASGGWQTSLAGKPGRTPYQVGLTSNWVIVALAEGGLACERPDASNWASRCE